MSEEVESPLNAVIKTIDRSLLTPIVRKALDNPEAEVTEWQVHHLTFGSVISHVFRVHGCAKVRTQSVPWSLILKIVSAPNSPMGRMPFASDEPSHFGYWQRELRLHQSDLLVNLPDGLVVPVSYQLAEQPEGCWLWMEDIVDGYGDTPWPLSRFGLAARHFGQFNGTYAVTGSLPDYPWLARDEGVAHWFSEQLSTDVYQRLVEVRDQHPLAQRAWPGDTAEAYRRLWAERASFFRARARLPQTLVHGDVKRQNLFMRRRSDGHEQTVAIDWGLVGIGAIGQELSTMTVGTVQWFSLPAAQLDELSETVFEAYLQGLRDVGWRGNVAHVRLGYVVDVALRFGFLTMPLEPQRMLQNEWWAQVEAYWARPMDEIVDHAATMRHFIISCADEARALMGSI